VLFTINELIPIPFLEHYITLAKEETVLQGKINRLIEIGRRYGMEMNVEKTKVMRISRQPSPIKIRVDKNNRRTWNISIMWVA
jgi:hypothetical protein